MYNKLFTKILDSSIWMEPTATRLVWMTFIASMDEEGFAQYASVANLAHRARLSIEETQAAVDCLEAPDSLTPHEQENEGRRIERVPGGWIILNSAKYREMVTKAIAKEKTRERVAKHREKTKSSLVTICNAPVTEANGLLHHQEQEHHHNQDQNQKPKLPKVVSLEVERGVNIFAKDYKPA